MVFRLCYVMLFPECADRLALKSIQLQVYKKDVPLDEAGFQQVLKSYDSGSMETFLRSG